jgi:hypothetical protein
VYEIREGIPVMLVEEARTVDDAEDERIRSRIENESIASTFMQG